MNTLIVDGCFKDVVKLHYHHERFFIEVIYEVDFEKTPKIVTPFVST